MIKHMFGELTVRHEIDPEFPGEDWGLFSGDDALEWFATEREAVKEATRRMKETEDEEREMREEEERERKAEEEDDYKQSLRDQIVELLEQIDRIDSLEGLLKSAKRLK